MKIDIDPSHITFKLFLFVFRSEKSDLKKEKGFGMSPYDVLAHRCPKQVPRYHSVPPQIP